MGWNDGQRWGSSNPVNFALAFRPPTPEAILPRMDRRSNVDIFLRRDTSGTRTNLKIGTTHGGRSGIRPSRNRIRGSGTAKTLGGMRTSQMKSHRFIDFTYLEIKALIEGGCLAILPTGCTEQQGPHLPVDFDT